MTDERITTNNSGDEADKTEPAAPVASENSVGVDEYIGIAIKSIAVALSIVVLLTSILSVSLPLVAMRTYNSLGMYERALVSGTRYINGEMKSTGLESDDIGKYALLLSDGGVTDFNEATQRSTIPVSLNNDDFIEAIDVCINLSDKLMRQSAAKGDIASAEYFAEYLEKYTRYFISLDGVYTVFSQKDSVAYETFPLSYIPYVYSYKHTLMTLNFRARYYMDALDNIMYDGGRGGDYMQTLSNQSNTFQGTEIPEITDNAFVSLLNRYIDYADQISEYIALELATAGVEEKLSELTEIQNKYRGRLNGTEFSLFLTKENGYSLFYENFKSVSKYAQAAVDFVPNNREEQLMKLYWLQRLNILAERCWNMEMLIWMNRQSYGIQMSAIEEKYNAFEYRRFNEVTILGKDENGKDIEIPSSLAVEYDKLFSEYQNIG